MSQLLRNEEHLVSQRTNNSLAQNSEGHTALFSSIIMWRSMQCEDWSSLYVEAQREFLSTWLPRNTHLSENIEAEDSLWTLIFLPKPHWPSYIQSILPPIQSSREHPTADHLELCPFRENEGQSIDAEKKMPFPIVLVPRLISPFTFLQQKLRLGWEREMTFNIPINSSSQMMAISSFFNLQHNKEQLGSSWRWSAAVNYLVN